MRRAHLVIALSAAAFLLAAAAAAAVALRPGRHDVTVGVLADGSLMLDGKRSDLPAVTERLAATAKLRGTVWYYRENPTATPSPEADKTIDAVMDLVSRYALPITFSSKPDYSDYMDGAGNSHPRAGP